MKLKKCAECSIASKRRQRVIGRGVMPADILFLGEAPGKAEDILGEPFVGPSGKLLDRIIDVASNQTGLHSLPTYYMTNTLLCRPFVLDEMDDEYLENREPSESEILGCMPNILQIAKSVKPRVVIFVGKVSEKYYAKEFPYTARILHPSYLLRHGGVSCPYYLTTVRILQELFKQLKEK